LIYEERIYGEKIYLRSVEMSDCNERYLSWLNDPDVNKYLETRHSVQNMNTIRQYVSSEINSSDSYLFAIINRETDEHVGNIRLSCINRFHLTAEVAILIGDKICWGKGFGTEAYILVVGFAFEKLGLYKCTLGVIASNVAGLKVVEKAGFLREGVLKEQTLNYLNQRDDAIRYGIINNSVQKTSE